MKFKANLAFLDADGHSDYCEVVVVASSEEEAIEQAWVAVDNLVDGNWIIMGYLSGFVSRIGD